MRPITSEKLTALIEAAGAGDRARVRERIRRLRGEAFHSGFRDGYRFGMRQAAERLRRQVAVEGVGPAPDDLLRWLDAEAARP